MTNSLSCVKGIDAIVELNEKVPSNSRSDPLLLEWIRYGDVAGLRIFVVA